MKIAFLSLSIFLLFSNIQGQDNSKTLPFRNEKLSFDQRARDLVSRLTVEEKTAVLHATFKGIPRLDIPKYYHGNEALHGIVRPGKFTVFPQAIAFAATWNPDLILSVSSAISTESRARWNELKQGENQKALYSDLLTFWSPDINLARDPRWGRTPETYGEDPFLTGRIAVSFIKGLQGDDPKYLKAVATPKHYTANNEEHNRFECNAIMTGRSLREYYLAPFETAIKEGKAESIMSAYNAVNGIPCTANKLLLTDILRTEWGFNGYVVSDCGGPELLVTNHKYARNKTEAAKMSLDAGLDLECGGDTYTTFMLDAFNKKLVTETQIDSAATRVLRARFRLGVYDNPELVKYNKIPPSMVGCKAHQDLALETARQSIVLLKNEKNLLPLNRKSVKSIAVFGINAANCEFGDYSGSPLNTPVSILDGIKAKAGKDIRINYLPWEVSKNTQPDPYSKEKKIAGESDYVIAVLGINKSIEREGQDKKDLNLPAEQEAFIKAIFKANPKTIVVLVTGSPLSITWIDANIPGIINAWYPGEQGGTAVADVLFGDYNPAGRLPITFYKSVDDLLPFDDYEISKGRTYLYLNKKPLYPFGFGLSYSKFEYTGMQMNKTGFQQKDSVEVKVTVRNIGKYNGEEVVQLYAHQEKADYKQPVKQLVAFKRVPIKKGGNRIVRLKFAIAQLRHWDETNKCWKIQSGDYKLMIGSSSENILLNQVIHVLN